MTPLVIGPWAIETANGPIPDLDDRLPRPNSLRRASEESKTSVLAASQVLDAWPREKRDRLAVFVAQQRAGLDYVAQFVNTAEKEGARFASPLQFSESVGNNAATHLSLTFGFTGVVETFIGSRIAGIQALAAACEDLETGAADGALIVVQNFSTPLTGDAYMSIYAAARRRPPSPPFPMLRGSLAFLVRRGGTEGLRLLFAGVRCAGRTRAARRRAVESLWNDGSAAVGKDARLHASALCLERRDAVPLIAGAVRREVSGESPPEESFSLDPFLRLFLDREPGSRAVMTLSEEGAAGLVAVAGGTGGA